jgi:hypothetical protein
MRSWPYDSRRAGASFNQTFAAYDTTSLAVAHNLLYGYSVI